MKAYKCSKFEDALDHKYLIDLFYSELDRQQKEEVEVHFENGRTRDIEFIHFMILDEMPSGFEYLAAKCIYKKMTNQSKVIRFVTEVQVYRDLFEQDFYMMLNELDNSVDPNPVLFN